MRYSKLKYDIEILELNHKHELEMLKMKHEMAKKELLKTCTHRWDDGSSASEFRGTQWDNWNACAICGRLV